MTEERADADSTKSSDRTDDSRRNFLKVSMVVSALLAAGGIAAVSKSVTNIAETPLGGASTPTTFPKVRITNISSLTVNQVVSFYYPLDNEPNILVKLGQAASGGVGPDGDIVAFSQLCQHLGCDYAFQATGSSPKCDPSYVAKGPEGYCCCHGSIYDYTNAGKVIGGPAPRPVPQVILEVDSSGDIYATGMYPPAIFGHSTGSSDVTADLQGGNVVS